MRFLLTNDDGYDAEGLIALHRAASALGECTVLAPESPQSCKGHGINDRTPLRFTTRPVEGMGTVGVLIGTPADCVRIGLQQANGAVDCVLSGINRGANLGLEVYYSGTVAAAREGAILGLPSIAFSQFFRQAEPPDWHQAAEWTRQLIDRLLRNPWPAGRFWNVNLPVASSNARPEQMRLAPLCLKPVPVDYTARQDSDGYEYRYSGRYEDRHRVPGSDVDLVFSGHITATPLRLDVTSI